MSYEFLWWGWELDVGRQLWSRLREWHRTVRIGDIRTGHSTVCSVSFPFHSPDAAAFILVPRTSLALSPWHCLALSVFCNMPLGSDAIWFSQRCYSKQTWESSFASTFLMFLFEMGELGLRDPPSSPIPQPHAQGPAAHLAEGES